MRSRFPRDMYWPEKEARGFGGLSACVSSPIRSSASEWIARVSGSAIGTGSSVVGHEGEVKSITPRGLPLCEEVYCPTLLEELRGDAGGDPSLGGGGRTVGVSGKPNS